MKEIKIIDSRQQADYSPPSVRVIDVRMRTSILNVSDPYTETQDGGNI